MSEISINNKRVKKIVIGGQTIYEPSDPVTALPMALPVTEIDDADIIMKNGQPFRDGGQKLKVTPNIKIVDANFQSWTVKDWHAAAVARGFDKTGVAAPVGFDIKAWGKHFVYYFRTKYTDTAGTSKTYYEVTGTTAITTGDLRHSAWQHTIDTFANGATRTYSIGVTATSTVYGDNLILSSSNSSRTWTIKKGITTKYSFETDNARDIYDALAAYTEWYRTLTALNTNIDTSEEDGTIGVVTILNSSGERPAIGDDMYFYINGTNTNILAKYNITGDTVSRGILIGDNLTSAMADAIYEKQKTNGVTMNDTYASGATKVIVTEGSKGAEAYAFNGKWYITTPVLSRCNLSQIATGSADFFIPDSPAISWVRWYNEQFSGENVPYMFMPDERMLISVKNNRPTCLNTLRSYLNHSQGDSWGIPDFPAGSVWSSVRYNSFNAWHVSLSLGYVNSSYTSYRYVAAAASAL